MLTEIIREAWIALKRNYTRSLLTMLGIVWGIATVTLLIAYGSSFRSILVNGFNAFGKGAVVCWPQQTSEQPGGQESPAGASRSRHGEAGRVISEACMSGNGKAPGNQLW